MLAWKILSELHLAVQQRKSFSLFFASFLVPVQGPSPCMHCCNQASTVPQRFSWGTVSQRFSWGNKLDHAFLWQRAAFCLCLLSTWHGFLSPLTKSISDWKLCYWPWSEVVLLCDFIIKMALCHIIILTRCEPTWLQINGLLTVLNLKFPSTQLSLLGNFRKCFSTTNESV